MKKTYTGTLFHPVLTDATFRLYVFTTSNKYEFNEMYDEEPQVVTYNNVESWTIIEGGEEAEELKAQGIVDDYDEYLILHLASKEEIIYRNSYVDMFIR